MLKPNLEKPSSPELCYLIGGMDCADCANKIETLVKKTAGASNPRVTFTTQTLKFNLDESITSRESFEAKIRALGYRPKVKTLVKFQRKGLAPTAPPALGESVPAAPHIHHDHDEEGEVDKKGEWYQTRHGQLVLVSAALLVMAFLFSYIAPSLSKWGYAAATIIGVWPLAKRAWAARALNPFGIGTLVVVAALSALLIGQAPEAAVVVFFFAVGELLEGIAAGRARAGIQSLANLAPKTALLIHETPHDQETKIHTHEIPVEDLKVGQTVQVQAGGRIPADGTILSGTSEVDDSPVTGESVPVLKKPGDKVYAGSINTHGVLVIRVDKDASDNTIARIIHLVEEAQESKAPTARFIDNFSRYYTPAVLLISVLVGVVPPLLFSQPWHTWLYKGIALLLIGCPCALVLSVPAAVTSGISAGARHGLLIKGGAILEAMSKIKIIAFDKTGTLTEGKPKVTDVIPVDISAEQLLAIAAGVEEGTSHPLGGAIIARAKEIGISILDSDHQRAISGKAVTAQIEGVGYSVSSPKFALEISEIPEVIIQQVESLEQSGKTVVVVLREKTILGIIAIRDEPRADAIEAIAQLRKMNITPVMLTGDNQRTAKAIAGNLGLEVKAELLPEDKLSAIDILKKDGGVAMIGDGINDAPALAQADIGIAMGSGTDVALETADAALLANEVKGVPQLIKLSRATMTNIKQNIGFALGLKLIFLITTLLGITNLWMAILADTGATALVTANAISLLRFNPSK